MIETKLKILGLKDDEIKTLLFLLTEGPAGAGTIAKKLQLGRPSLYGYLKNLIEKGLVTQSTKNGIKIFSPAPQDTFDLVFENRIQKLKEAKHKIADLFEDLQNKKNWSRPKLQIFEGKEEMRNLAKDFLLYRNTHTQSYWPIKSMIKVLGEEFFRDFNIERVKRNIWVDAIWPENEIINIDTHPFMGAGEEFLREIRKAPSGIHFSMGYWIYENKVAFISSEKSNFGFIVENEEFAQMLRSQFNILWQLSKKQKQSSKEASRAFEKMLKGN